MACFPIRSDGDHDKTETEAGLVRTADLTRQLGDPFYPRKLNALFHEFVETRTAAALNYTTPSGGRKFGQAGENAVYGSTLERVRLPLILHLKVIWWMSDIGGRRPLERSAHRRRRRLDPDRHRHCRHLCPDRLPRRQGASLVLLPANPNRE